jgi:hypothetical protein
MADQEARRDGYVLPLVWLAARGVYVDQLGKVVPERVLRQALQTVMADSSARLGMLAERFTDGRLSALEWRTAMRDELETSYGLAAALAHGGVEAMDATAWATLGAELRHTYGFVDQFALQVEQGTVSVAQAVTRAAMYAGGAHMVYELFRRGDAQQRGETQERNILQPGDNCAGCLAATDAGWVSVGTLPHPGERDCLTHCRCTLEFRTVDVASPVGT